MKTVNAICSELKKIVINPYFLAGVLAFTMMCFGSSGYYDAAGSKEYSIFEMMTMLGTDKAALYEFSAQYVCTRGFGSWLVMFLGIIVSFPFVKLLCDERRCNEKRYLISRTGVFRYCLSKFTGAVVSAALICALGYLLFSGAVYIIFPKAEAGTVALSLPYWKCFLEAVLTGMCVSVLPFLICTVTANKYFCICIPFLMQYMYNTAIGKFTLDAKYGGLDIKTVILQSLSPDNISSILYDVKKCCYTLAFYAAFAVIALLLFSFAQRRYTDIGQ